MKVKSVITWAVAMPIALAAPNAFAHPIGFHAEGFAAGLAHPFFGIDHVLAMVAIGVWAARYGGRTQLAAAPAFIAAIGAGGVLAMSGAVLPYVEAGIAATVVALGLLIALAVRLPAFVGGSLASLFALWHGYAHGSEWTAMASPLPYVAGFIVASLSLVIVAVYAARLTVPSDLCTRLVGGSVAAAGLVLLASV